MSSRLASAKAQKRFCMPCKERKTGAQSASGYWSDEAELAKKEMHAIQLQQGPRYHSDQDCMCFDGDVHT